ncbi:hypothetical protein FA09DRAFT_111790 [Tilletiopsis washingtonensis]|uniref:Uncharacterized protein n=1 Tax=Tilletiopsis washingtonensis TaxID=58919 RepID=A0A316ZGU4_9BASI|nr:hypothetical protein FA09DRAFT_111790 [Tilletiopsis washingtonensis]PWO00732.1 hypothetical protein FA09DRAFT_111790 [Tilletiopsis washingtonensis]
MTPMHGGSAAGWCVVRVRSRGLKLIRRRTHGRRAQRDRSRGPAPPWHDCGEACSEPLAGILPRAEGCSSPSRVPICSSGADQAATIKAPHVHRCVLDSPRVLSVPLTQAGARLPCGKLEGRRGGVLATANLMRCARSRRCLVYPVPRARDVLQQRKHPWDVP